jgi:tetratricopeptide (TPR) repeat protein
MPTPCETGRCEPRLSVAIIVRDDADGLAETLASIQGLADETIVLDTGSHDGTQDVARRSGAKLVERPWDECFSAARNACFAHTTGDWVLWLDSGERFSPKSREAIRECISRENARSSAYRAILRVPPPTTDAQAEQIAPVRLIPRVASLRFEGRVRESLAASLSAAEISVESSNIVIERTAREHTPERKLAKARRDLRLAQRAFAEHGNAAHVLLAKGEACATLARPAEAIDLLRLAITSAAAGSSTQLAAYGSLLATLDKLDVAGEELLRVKIAVGLEALDVFPLDAQLLLAMGGYLQSQGQTELAARSFRVAWEHGTADPDVWHVADARALAASCLSLALQSLGQDEEAVSVLVAALRNTTDEARLRRRLVELHIRSGNRDAALAEIDELVPDGERPLLRAVVRGTCLAAAGNWIGAIAQLEPAYRQGCRDALCRRAYLNALLATGQNTAAHRIAEEWLAESPDHAEAQQFRAAARGEKAAPSPAKQPAALPLSTASGAPSRSARRVDVAAGSRGPAVPAPTLPALTPTTSQANIQT